MEESIHRHINEEPDSIEFGTPSKGGAVKVYGNYKDMDSFKKKIDNAKEIRKYADANLSIGLI